MLALANSNDEAMMVGLPWAGAPAIEANDET
jgi:hypothetical protein